jgi:hypothetical protein
MTYYKSMIILYCFSDHLNTSKVKKQSSYKYLCTYLNRLSTLSGKKQTEEPKHLSKRERQISKIDVTDHHIAEKENVLTAVPTVNDI